VDIRSVARKMGINPLPFSGQAIFVMVLHAVLTDIAWRLSTVDQFMEKDPEQDALFEMFGYATLVAILGLSALFWVLGRRQAFRRTIVVYMSIGTLALLFNCMNLVETLGLRSNETGGAFALLGDAAITWATNVLNFAILYWFLDQGGPDRRGSAEPGRPDLAFPQQTTDLPGWNGWKPGILDYVFVAFNTSTAFSPTDTTVLSHRAKILCMVQAGISLIIIAMLAGRVVNMLGT